MKSNAQYVQSTYNKKDNQTAHCSVTKITTPTPKHTHRQHHYMLVHNARRIDTCTVPALASSQQQSIYAKITWLKCTWAREATGNTKCQIRNTEHGIHEQHPDDTSQIATRTANRTTTTQQFFFHLHTYIHIHTHMHLCTYIQTSTRQ